MLRGIAVLMVACAHLFSVEAKLGGPTIIGKWALNGFAGVDLFFVISGFIMAFTNQYNFGRISAVPRFWFLRVFRIYPLWILVCGAIYAVWLYHPDWVYQSHHSNPDILKSFLLIPQNELPLHAVGWTLIHELWFYFVFGIILVFPRILSVPLLLIWAGFIVFSYFSPIFAMNEWVSLFTHPLSIEFIAGALCGIFLAKSKFGFSKSLIMFSIAITIVLMTKIDGNGGEFFAARTGRALYFTLPFVFLILGIVSLEKEHGHFPKFLSKIGDWSYSLYLLHVPVFAAFVRLFAPFSDPNSVLDNIAFIALATFAAILASFVTYSLFERPIITFAHRIIAPRPAKVATNNP